MTGPIEPVRAAPDRGDTVSHQIAVARTARYFTLGPTHGFPRELWLVCHGYGQLAAAFLQRFAPLDDGTRLIAAPEALSRFYLDPLHARRGQPDPRVGASWMTRESRETEIADYVEYLERVLEQLRRGTAGAAPRLVVLGFSQGCATVCRWLARSGHRADHLVLWGGAVPPELKRAEWAARLHGARITLVGGEEDTLAPFTATAAEAEALALAGIAHAVIRHSGGHAIEADVLEMLAASLASP